MKPKSKIIFTIITILLATACVLTMLRIQALQKDARVQESTKGALESENQSLRSRLSAGLEISSDSAPSVSSAPASSAPPASNSSGGDRGASREAVDAVAGYMKVLNAVDDKTTLQQQTDAMKPYATEKEKERLWGTGEARSDTGGDGPSRASFSSSCDLQNGYTSQIDDNTIDVFGTFKHHVSGPNTQTDGIILVTARCVKQDGRWMVDYARQAIPSNLYLQDFKIEN